MIEATVKGAEVEQVEKYPFIGIMESGPVVLFVEAGCGTVLISDGEYGIGEYSDCWDMDEFKLYTGTITLKNKI